MATYTQAQGTRSSSLLTMGTLAAATYIASSAIDLGASIPEDVTFQVEADVNGTPDGNKQVKVFLKLSLDNTDYGSGPESGTTATEESDLHLLGILPCNDTNTHRKYFSLATAGIPVSRYIKIVVKNDCATTALTSGAVYKADITGAS